MTSKDYVSGLLDNIDHADDSGDLDLANSLLPGADRAVVEMVSSEMALNGNKEPEDVAEIHRRFIDLRQYIESELANRITRSP